MASRPRCSVFIATSLDGHIARADGSIDWLDAVAVEGEDYGYAEFTASVDALTIGRNTYETALGFEAWPYAGKRCIVFTHRPPAGPRANETFYHGGPAVLLDQLGREGVRRVYVDGGNLIQQFLRGGLVDDLTLSIIPVILGGGPRLFDGAMPEQRLTLDSVRSWPSGLAQLRYRAR